MTKEKISISTIQSSTVGGKEDSNRLQNNTTLAKLTQNQVLHSLRGHARQIQAQPSLKIKNSKKGATKYHV